MKLIIAGSRDVEAKKADALVRAALGFAHLLGHPTEIVCGEATGIDAAGKRWADSVGLPVASFPADWDTLGKAAGPIRNEAMAKHADVLLAVWDGKSKGTKDMVDKMAKAGKPFVVYNFNDKVNLPAPDCEACGGSGFVEDPEAGFTKVCRCSKQG